MVAATSCINFLLCSYPKEADAIESGTEQSKMEKAAMVPVPSANTD